MTCDDYLSMLETLPVEEMAYGDAREHAARCPDCHRVTRVVVERERNMRLAYGDVRSTVPPMALAAQAVATASRRRTAFFYQLLLGVAAAVTVVAMIATRRVTPPAIPLIQETFFLRCISPQEAAERVRLTGTTGRVVIPSQSVSVIRVEASPKEMRRVRSTLDRFSDKSEAGCAAPVPPAPVGRP